MAESFDRFLAYRLGAVERQTPATEVERIALLGRNLVDTQIVRKVWPTADRGAVLADHLEPAKRFLQKRNRRDQNIEQAHVHGLQNPAD